VTAKREKEKKFTFLHLRETKYLVSVVLALNSRVQVRHGRLEPRRLLGFDCRQACTKRLLDRLERLVQTCCHLVPVRLHRVHCCLLELCRLLFLQTQRFIDMGLQR